MKPSRSRYRELTKIGGREPRFFLGRTAEHLNDFYDRHRTSNWHWLVVETESHKTAAIENFGISGCRILTLEDMRTILDDNDFVISDQIASWLISPGITPDDSNHLNTISFLLDIRPRRQKR